MFPTNQLYRAKSVSNLLPYSAMSEAFHLANLEDKNLATLLQKKIGKWGDSSNPWSTWIANKYVYEGVEYAGSLTVRISKLYKHMFGEPVDTNLLSRVGATLGQYKKEVDLFWTIDRIFHWEPGDFAERDGKSCWWQGNNYCRVGLAARPNARVILFFRDEEQYEKNEGKKGIGRSWLVEQEDKGRAIIFNAYGVSLSDTADILATKFDMKAKKVRIYSQNAYLNAGNLNNINREGGEEGLGYVIAPDVSEYSSSSTLEIEDFSSTGAECSVCGKKHRPSQLHLRGYKILCETCLDKLYPRCAFCGNAEDPNGMKQVFYSGQHRNCCTRCYITYDLGSKEHFCEIHGNTFDITYPAWHTNKRYCPTCIDIGVATRCYTCKRIVNDYVRLEHRLGINMCVSCSRKMVVHIQKSPRLGHRNKAQE